jgi:acyl-coenzyme A thioesterase PaaI-like protein
MQRPGDRDATGARDGTDGPVAHDEAEARRTLADAVRALVPATLLTTAGADAMAAATALVRSAVDRLGRATRPGRYDGIAGLAPGIGVNDAVWETHAVYGRSQPFAPPLTVTEEPGRLEATFTFGAAYEGGPASAYGGFVAAVFDGACGRAVIGAGHLAVTRTLHVRFLRPTPLNRELRVEAIVGERRGDDVEVRSRLWAGDTLTSEADATFAIVDPRRYRR